MTDAIFVYVTVPTMKLARMIAAAAIEDRLAACANIMDGMTSFYRWKGEIEEAKELVLILKTRADLFEKLAEKVRGLHPYECPCIVALPLCAGTVDYLNWINDSVKEEPQ